ncbi:MAG: hypothetical protein EP330_21320 [Deltaproteobacteria bacterium]|nr:MAG: hypothetical protein EP330_21320 [Deltaproteobacteria bacterium]
MQLPESFQPDISADAIRFRVQGLGAPRGMAPSEAIATFAGWSFAGLMAASPVGLFLLGPTGPDYLPIVTTLAAAAASLGALVGVVRVAAHAPGRLPTEAQVRIDRSGVTVDGEHVGWRAIRGLLVDGGEMVVDLGAAGQVRVAVDLHTPEEREALARVLEQAWTAFGVSAEQVHALESEVRRLKQGVRV